MHPTQALLHQSRQKLLDLTLRNALLNYNFGRRGRLVIVDELPHVLYEKLIDGKKMKLSPIPYPNKPEDIAIFEQYGWSTTDLNDRLLYYPYQHTLIQETLDKIKKIDRETGYLNARIYAQEIGISIDEEMPIAEYPNEQTPQKHRDNSIQTLHYTKQLEAMMYKRRAEANSAIAETGSNLLFLAVGFLRWKQNMTTDRELFAPLVLIPIEITRGTAHKSTGVYSYSINYTDEDLLSNISLIYKIRQEFGVELPQFDEEQSIEEYFSKVERVCESRGELLGVSRRFALDFFHFSKLLMYLDLDSANWEEHRDISKHPLLMRIAGETPTTEATSSTDPTLEIENENIPLVMDADSSQRDAIAQVLRGESLIIEGPPGTGKSQTIANLIAIAMAEGKQVLFVAEKLVALEVVKKRLDSVGLGEFILELHSRKSNKSSVYASLKERVECKPLSKPKLLQESREDMEQIKEQIETYLNLLHRPYAIVGETPYAILGEVQYRADSDLQKLPTQEQYLTIDSTHLQDIVTTLQSLDSYIAEDNALLSSPWMGLQVTDAIVLEVEDISYHLQQLCEHYAEVLSLAEQEPLYAQMLQTPSGIERLIEIDSLGLLAHIPKREDIEIVASMERDKLREIIKMSLKLIEYERLLDEIDLDAIEKLSDIDQLSRRLRGYRDISWIGKWFDSGYKESRKRFNEIILIDTDNTIEAMVERLKQSKKSIEDYMQLLVTIYEQGGASLLTQLKQEPIDPQNLQELSEATMGLYAIAELESVVSWQSQMVARGLSVELTNALVRRGYRESLLRTISRAKQLKEEQEHIYRELSIYAKIDEQSFFDEQNGYEQRLQLLREKLTDTDSLVRWIDVSPLLTTLYEYGLEDVLSHAKKHQLEQKLEEVVLYGYYREWAYHILRTHEILSKFNRHLMATSLRRYQELDEKLGSLYALKQIGSLSKTPIPKGRGGKVAQKTEMHLIRNEIRKQKRHLPIRQLLKRSSKAIRALKPCFMMSPLSVAQFIDPSQEPFDLIIMDEASQILPEDALGAIARAKQVVVVGDPNQLPPTSFFSSSMEDEDTEETVATTAESILDLMLRVYPEVRRLKWHYRSQHESLIAFSNQHFYDSELMIFPSPVSCSEVYGVVWRYIEGGYYKEQQNPTEATAIVEAICHHIAEQNSETLGVVAMNKKQAELIANLLEEQCTLDSHKAQLLDEALKAEKLFIKNLESVQGDEADILFIGVTYGLDEQTGRVYQRFGPINGEHGWRRINVLITRARRRIELFSSLKSHDIVPSPSNRGRMALRNYLHYVENNHKVEKEAQRDLYKGDITPFERSVIEYINSLGYIAQPHIGVSGFFIDIGVMVEGSDEYILGIECDSEAYYENKSTRDRERIRPQLLESMGWHIYRIWSVDWFKNREAEEERVVKVLENLREV